MVKSKLQATHRTLTGGPEKEAAHWYRMFMKTAKLLERVAKTAADLKKQLSVSRKVHLVYRKAAVGAIAEVKRQLAGSRALSASLKDEIDELKADALDQLNDRAEVIGELLQRAVPEGWEPIAARRDGHLRIVRLVKVTHRDGERLANPILEWHYSMLGKNGPCYGSTPTLAAACAAAEKIQIEKRKKR